MQSAIFIYNFCPSVNTGHQYNVDFLILINGRTGGGCLFVTTCWGRVKGHIVAAARTARFHHVKVHKFQDDKKVHKVRTSQLCRKWYEIGLYKSLVSDQFLSVR